MFSSCVQVWLNTSFISFIVFQLKKEDWAPDFGPATFVPSWGATVTGARKFLVAYNVNLIGTKEQAHRIALDVREQGRGKDQVHASLALRCGLFPASVAWTDAIWCSETARPAEEGAGDGLVPG